MKKFAKISAVLAAMALAFSFAGCSDGSSGSGSDSSEITGEETSGGETSGGETSGGETSGGETSGGETSSDKYSITYELDGGTNASDNPASYTIEDSITLKTPAKDGFVFLGWYTDSEFENKITEIAKGSTGEKTLYAQWWNSTDFVKVPAVSIEKIETLKPESNVLIKGRNLEIKAFWMSDHEVTQAEWKAVMGTTPSGMANTYGNPDNNPVNMVNWYDAIVYCNKRSIKEGLTPCYKINGSTNPNDWNNGNVPTSDNATWNAVTCEWNANGYRLPTEAEWEWAARGGENYTYAGSENIDEVAWYIGNWNDTGTREVKTKNVNGYELYDMSGNVYEWCWDWEGNISSSTLAAGASSGSYRVKRGGCWSGSGDYCEVAYRDCSSPSHRDYILGFRVVRSCD